MKFIFTLSVLFTLFDFLGQNLTINWGELERPSGQLLKIQTLSNGDFVSLRSGDGMFGSYKISSHHNLQNVTTGKIKVTLEQGMGNFNNLITLDDKIYVLLYDVVGKVNSLYIQEYDRQITPISKPKLIANYSFEKLNNPGYFSVILSENKNYFAVVWEISGNKTNNDRYGFVVYDKTLKEINSGDYKLPFPGENSTIDEQLVSNFGDYFLLVTEYKPIEKKGLFKRIQDYKAVHLLQVNENGLDDFTIDLEGKRVEAMGVDMNADYDFSIVGIYGKENFPGVSGMFYMKINFKEQQILKQGFKEFDKDFVTQDWSDKELLEAEKNEEKGKGEPALFNYYIHDLKVLQDGSIVGSMEQYYSRTVNTSDGRGSIRTTTYYYYNDIIAFKINTDGNFDWLQKFSKYQASINDNGYYSSYFSYFENDKMNFVFNDHVKNYDANLQYLPNQGYSFSIGKKNAVAFIALDIKDGAYTRNAIFNAKEAEAIIIPKKFVFDPIANNILIYAIFGRYERYGIYNIKP